MKENIKLSNILVLFFIVLYIIIAGGSDLKPDYVNYKLMYESLDISLVKDYGFYILIVIGRLIGLNYNQFQLLFFSIGYMIIAYACLKWFKIKLIFFIYFLYPFFWDTVQIRNFLGMAFLIVSIKFVIERKFYKFLFSIIIAGSIHSIFYLYFPIFFLATIRVKNYFYYIFITYFILVIILISTVKQINWFFFQSLSYFIKIFPDDRLRIYSEYKMNYGHLLYITLQLSGFIVFKFFKDEALRSHDINQLKLITILQNINIYVLAFMPLYLFESTYFRMFRNIYVVNQIVLITFLSRAKKSKNIILLYLLVFGYTILFVFFDLLRPILKSVIIPVLSSNYLV